MRGHRVAGKRGLVHQQHPVAVARQQHRGRRSSAARSDDDRVVVRTHRASPFFGGASTVSPGGGPSSSSFSGDARRQSRTYGRFVTVVWDRWIAVGFAIGSLCFFVGPFQGSSRLWARAPSASPSSWLDLFHARGGPGVAASHAEPREQVGVRPVVVERRDPIRGDPALQPEHVLGHAGRTLNASGQSAGVGSGRVRLGRLPGVRAAGLPGGQRSASAAPDPSRPPLENGRRQPCRLRVLRDFGGGLLRRAVERLGPRPRRRQLDDGAWRGVLLHRGADAPPDLIPAGPTGRRGVASGGGLPCLGGRGGGFGPGGRELRANSHKGLKKAGGASTSAKLTLQIGLVANNSGIQSAAKKASNPKSDSYGKYPSLSTLQSKWGAKSSVRKGVVNAFKSQGVTAKIDVTHLRATATVSIGKAQKMFGTKWAVYHTSSGNQLVALPVNTPKLPKGMKGNVDIVAGLRLIVSHAVSSRHMNCYRGGARLRRLRVPMTVARRPGRGRWDRRASRRRNRACSPPRRASSRTRSSARTGSRRCRQRGCADRVFGLQSSVRRQHRPRT